MPNVKKIYTFVLLVLLLASGPAWADCINPPAAEGKIIFNGDYNLPQVCNGDDWLALGILNPGAGGSGCSNPTGTEGQVIYNGDIHVPQYCDGDDWREMIGYLDSPGGGGCTPDPACPNVGDVCSGDGSGGGNPIFAGCITYYDANSADAGVTKAIYVTQDNQSTSSQWKTAMGTDDIATDSTEDGQINDGQVANSTTFPAFKLCKDLADGGFTDWYLPARTELDLLWRNSGAINTIAAGNFTTSTYWSSTEDNTSNVWHQSFSSGYQLTSSKPNASDIRCVRRD